MLEKTTGIILNQIKYSDSGNVLQVYTRHHGRQAFLVRGIRNKKQGRQNVHLQPLSIIEIVHYFKESRTLQTLKEFSVSYLPADIYNNIVKTSIALFLGEVLTVVLREEVEQQDLFDYIHDSVVYLDRLDRGFSNFHIAFLCGLCSYLGIEPGRKEEEGQCFFDLNNGSFGKMPPPHGNYAGAEVSALLWKFFSSSWNDMSTIILSGQLRNELLISLVSYYATHIPAVGKINSLEVLKEVFSDGK